MKNRLLAFKAWFGGLHPLNRQAWSVFATVLAFSGIAALAMHSVDVRIELPAPAHPGQVGPRKFGATVPFSTVTAGPTYLSGHYPDPTVFNIAPTGNIAWGNHKITGLSAGSGAGDSVRYEQVGLLDGTNAWGASQSWGSHTLTSLANGILDTDAANVGQLSQPLYADFVATSLAAYTYANGSNGGIGATITANANGAIGNQDGQTVSANQKIFLPFESAGANDGLWDVTTVGDGSHAFVLTRDPANDTQAKLRRSTIYVKTGTAYGASSWTLDSSIASITVGTTALTFSPTLSPAVELDLFGDGSGGALAGGAGTTTLTDDTSYTTVTLQAGDKIITNGFDLRIRTLDITTADAGAIQWNGAAGGTGAAATTGGTAGAVLTAATLGGAPVGGIGAAGTTTTGAQGLAAGAAPSPGNGGGSGVSGAGAGSGASGGNNAGGGARAAVAVALPTKLRRVTGALLRGASLIQGGAAGGGGGSGAGDGATAGPGGGGGGSGGGVLRVVVRTLITGGSTPAGVFQVKGGNGGIGGTPAGGNRGGAGAGGGGGGGWGVVAYLVRKGAAVASLADATGGAGAAGGAGTGTGVGGHGSDGGTGGRLTIVSLLTGTATETLGSVGGAGAAGSGNTAGTAGSAGACVATF